MFTPGHGIPQKALLVCMISLIFAASSFAAIIDFQDAAVGTVITDQYSAQGVVFDSGVIDHDYVGGLFLRVPDTSNPYMSLLFNTPVYTFSARVYETISGFEPPPPSEDEVPPESGTDPVDLPPADDNKPSIYPTLHFSDGTSFDLAVIHALGEWKTLSFNSAVPVTGLSLLGHYEPETSPIYFFIDDIALNNDAHRKVVPEPATVGLFFLGLAGIATMKNAQRAKQR